MIEVREPWPRAWWVLAGLAWLVVAVCIPFFDTYQTVATGVARAAGIVALPALGVALTRTVRPLRVHVDPWQYRIGVRAPPRRWRWCDMHDVLVATTVQSRHAWIQSLTAEELELWTHPPAGWRQDGPTLTRHPDDEQAVTEMLEDDPTVRAFVVPIDRLRHADARTVMGLVPADRWSWWAPQP